MTHPTARRRHLARTSPLFGFFGLMLTILGWGCDSPFQDDYQTGLYRLNIERAVQRELAATPDGQAPIQASQTPSDVEKALESRREELDRLSPAVGQPKQSSQLGSDLSGTPQQEVAVSLDQAVASAVRNNLGVLSSRFGPAISDQQLIAAQAAFDAVWFGSAELAKIDEPSVVPTLLGLPLSSPFNAFERNRFETGIRKLLTTGGTVSVSTDLVRTQDNTPGSFALTPDPAYGAAARLRVTQPLLRGFGTNVNTAVIRLTRNDQQRSVELLTQELLRVVDETEAAYWDLVRGWERLVIAQWLEQVGLEVRDVLDARFRANLDVNEAQRSDAIAQVEQRRADVIRARRAVREASDVLKTLMNDPEVPMGSERVLLAVDPATAAPMQYNLGDAVRTALQHRPEIHAALLSIDDAAIRQEVADNDRLPLLNLAAEMGYFGLDDTARNSYENLSDGDFIDYAVGLAFEWPLGNRAAEAGYQESRLRRAAALVDYRAAVQNVVREVKAALRDVLTNYELIAATRSARLAAAENLRTLRVQEQTMAGLTPEFLNLKFQRQDALARAQLEEVAAITNYNRALAALARAMGTALDARGISIELMREAPAILESAANAEDSAAN